jgi:hypothetical protein
MALMAKKGQTTLEYTTILAVVLVIGLIVVGLTLFFSQSSGSVTEAEAEAYWASQARPIRVIGMQGYYYSSMPSSGEIGIVVENIDSKPITITGLLLEPYSDSAEEFSTYANHSTDGSTTTLIGVSTPSSPLWENGIRLAPNERYSFFIRAATICSTSTSASASSERFRNYLTIYYNTPDFTGLSFKGLKPIMGKCHSS